MADVLKTEEQEWLREEVEALLQALPMSRCRRATRLWLLVSSGARCRTKRWRRRGNCWNSGLQSGRIRRQHRANGEQALLRLFNQTPAGKALAEQTADVEPRAGAGDRERALAVAGARVYLLQIVTDGCELTLRLDADGPAVESLDVGI